MTAGEAAVATANVFSKHTRPEPQDPQELSVVAYTHCVKIR
jgi:hypothetical protein